MKTIFTANWQHQEKHWQMTLPYGFEPQTAANDREQPKLDF